jgi:hypothetical protein
MIYGWGIKGEGTMQNNPLHLNTNKFLDAFTNLIASTFKKMQLTIFIKAHMISSFDTHLSNAGISKT